MRVALLSLACLIVACGGSDEREAVSETGRLVVEKSSAERPLFIEGSVTHVRIVRADGATIIDETRLVGSPLFDEALRPGDYAVETVERPAPRQLRLPRRAGGEHALRTDVRVRIGATTTVAIVLGMMGARARRVLPLSAFGASTVAGRCRMERIGSVSRVWPGRWRW